MIFIGFCFIRLQQNGQVDQGNLAARVHPAMVRSPPGQRSSCGHCHQYGHHGQRRRPVHRQGQEGRSSHHSAHSHCAGMTGLAFS